MPYFKEKYRKAIDSTFVEMKHQIYTKVGDLAITAWLTKEPVSYDDRMSGTELHLEKGDKWGNLWDCAWFNFKGCVPPAAKGKSVVLMIDLSGEGCIFDGNGTPTRGLTTVASTFDLTLGMPGKRIIQWIPCAEGNEIADIWVDAGCNDLFGNLVSSGIITEAGIGVCNENLRSLFYDFQVLISLMDALDKNSARANQILFNLYEAVNVLKDYSEEYVQKAREITAAELNKKNGDSSLSFAAIGHAHIDLAWLWPIRETIRKGARTFSTAVELLERYPGYIFGASQPQLYDWIKSYYPGLYAKIKDKVADGSWEAQGAMWVESDTNLVSGESLVRQIMYGKRFYKQEFDKDIDVLWLPDVFGYTGSLPQILKKSGVPYFMTQKLSWSEHNKFPHQTFIWEGIDGSQVLTHMLPESTYNSPMSPKLLNEAERNYPDNGICDEALSLFGIGDGGGGPGPEHLERLSRMRNLAGIPPVRPDLSTNFFKRINRFAPKLKKWSGELYLERHQGTYTTQAKSKLFNRKMELALRELEFALILKNDFTDYPKDELDKIWKEVLLYQFHDIIPGSSIKRVYDESLERYAILLKRVADLKDQCYQSMVKQADRLTAFNSLSWPREEIVFFGGSYYRGLIPSMGFAELLKIEVSSFTVKAEKNLLENENLKVVLGDDGSVTSIYNKKARFESLAAGTKSNVLHLYEDKGDCWDIDITYLDKKPDAFTLESQSFFVEGPDAVCRQIYRYNGSVVHQDVVLRHQSASLAFRTKVLWQENQLMLRTSFHTTVRSETASFEIQFGKIDRTTHENTSWDMAQFEVCAHRWVDLSQADHGVALLNDSKYGHRVAGSTIDLNLLRAQNYPGINADRGEQEFSYAIYPHAGDETAANVVKEAHEFNVPLSVYKGISAAVPSQSFIHANPDIVIDTVKRAEDSDDVIVRMYEPYGQSVKADIRFDGSYQKIEEVDLLENRIRTLAECTDSLWYELKPFEIVTLKLTK